jgi:invasion protein IalB
VILQALDIIFSEVASMMSSDPSPEPGVSAIQTYEVIEVDGGWSVWKQSVLTNNSRCSISHSQCNELTPEFLQRFS